MTIKKIQSVNNPEREQTRLRVIFGCLSGLMLSLTAWGLDAYILQDAHSYLPWIKFALGAIIAIPLYGLAGYVISRLGGKYFITFLSFSASGFIISWVAAHLSYDIYNKLIGWVNPGLASRIDFVYDESAQASFILTAVILIVMSAILSFFYELLILQAYSAQAKTSLITALLVILVFFAVGGYLLDYFDNQAQRPPIVQTSVYISRAQSIQAGDMAYEKSLMSRERVFLDLNIDLNRDFKLARVSYDPLIKASSVYILFDNEWYDCMVVDDQPFFCEGTSMVE